MQQLLKEDAKAHITSLPRFMHALMGLMDGWMEGACQHKGRMLFYWGYFPAQGTGLDAKCCVALWIGYQTLRHTKDSPKIAFGQMLLLAKVKLFDSVLCKRYKDWCH